MIKFANFVTVLFLPFYVDGQEIAAKVSKQITQRTNSLKIAVEKYNASLAAWKNKVDGLPEELDFDGVKDPESNVFDDFRGNTHVENQVPQVPFPVRRSVIDLHNFVERCKEELSYLHVEMVRLVSYHVTEKARFQEWIDENSDDTLVYVRGINCVLERKKREEDNKLCSVGSKYGNFLPFEVVSSIPQFEYKFVSIDTTTDSVATELFQSDQSEDEDSDDEDSDKDICLMLESSEDEGSEYENEVELS